MTVRGLRGAVTTDADTTEAILQATRRLLEAVCQANPALRPADLASVLFTVTPDLSAAYPALAARQLGWREVPLMCAQEIPVPNALPRCIRLLAHWNTDLPQSAIRHVYLDGAASLRPDLAAPPPAA